MDLIANAVAEYENPDLTAGEQASPSASG